MKLEETGLGKPMPTSVAGIFLANVGKEDFDKMVELQDAFDQEPDPDLSEEASEKIKEEKENDLIHYLLNAPILVAEDGTKFEGVEDREYVGRLPITLRLRMLKAMKEGFDSFKEKLSIQGETV